MIHKMTDGTNITVYYDMFYDCIAVKHGGIGIGYDLIALEDNRAKAIEGAEEYMAENGLVMA